MDGHMTAAEASREAGVTLRRLVGLDDARLVIELIQETWGEGQPHSAELVLALEVSGSLVLGAFDADRLAGFSLGFYGDEGGMHFHSHMLAVEPAARRRGIGYALKLAQREACLDAGVPVMRWTFDPLQTRNASFNLERLGVIADRFARDFYGTMEDSQSLGDRGDRLWARWDLEEARRAEPPADALRVQTPDDYWQLRTRDPVAAQAVRNRVADDLEAAFAEGLQAVAFREGGYLFA